MENKKVTFNTKNFNKENTPIILSRIANGLVYASPIITGIVMGSPIQNPEFIIWFNWIFNSIIAVFKLASKFFGVEIK